MSKEEQTEVTEGAAEAVEEAPKKKSKKKKLIVLLVFVVVIAIIVTVAAVLGVNSNKAGFRFDKTEAGDGYIAMGYNPTKEEQAEGYMFTLKVPEEYNGLPVLEFNGINSYAAGHVTAIVLPDSVKVIRKSACSLSTLTSVTVGNGLEEIGERGFQNAKLKSLTLPESLKKIGSQAFLDCYFRDAEGNESFTINYQGSPKQWEAIEKADDWAGGRKINIQYAKEDPAE